MSVGMERAVYLSRLVITSGISKEIDMNTNKDDRSDKSAIKDPDEWVTGEEPMTGAQESYIHTLAREAGEPVKEDLTKAEASKKIEELQKRTGRGLLSQITSAQNMGRK